MANESRMTIFVGGIHAVGKTHLLRPVCDQLKLRYASASALIREELGKATWNESKQVATIDQNQAVLISAVNRIREKQIVIDGHFVLRSSELTLQEIPTSVFVEMHCAGLLLLTAPPELVAQRLSARGDTSWTLDQVKELALAEQTHAESVAKAIGVILEQLQQPTEGELTAALSRLMANRGS